MAWPEQTEKTMLTLPEFASICIVAIAFLMAASSVGRLLKGRRRRDSVAVSDLRTDRRGTPVAETPEGEMWEHLMNRGCLDCGTKDDCREGPSGGMSTNIFCARCGAGYNITPMIGIAERIGNNPAAIDHGRYSSSGKKG
jgi:hypothetical protein